MGCRDGEEVKAGRGHEAVGRRVSISVAALVARGCMCLVHSLSVRSLPVQ